MPKKSRLSAIPSSDSSVRQMRNIERRQSAASCRGEPARSSDIILWWIRSNRYVKNQSCGQTNVRTGGMVMHHMLAYLAELLCGIERRTYVHTIPLVVQCLVVVDIRKAYHADTNNRQPCGRFSICDCDRPGHDVRRRRRRWWWRVRGSCRRCHPRAQACTRDGHIGRSCLYFGVRPRP